MGLFSKILGKNKNNDVTHKEVVISSEEKVISEPKKNDVGNKTTDSNNHPKLGYKCVSCGLYPVEILMIACCERYVEGQSEFPGFWTYKYDMAVPKQVLDHVADLGFVILESPFKSLNSLKVGELKDVLKEKSLPVSGKKDELIERIKSNCTESEIEPLVVRHYTPSESGSKAVKDNDYIPFLHSNSRHVSVNPLSVNRELKGEPCSGFEELESVLKRMEDECNSSADRAQLSVNREILRCCAYGEKIDESDSMMDAIYNTMYQTARNYQRAGFTHAVWLIADDDKCCPICCEMNGKKIDLSAEHLVLPPAHKGCRCTIIADVDSYSNK